MPQGSPDGNNAASLLHKLCLKITGKNQDDVLHHFRNFLTYMSSTSLDLHNGLDEFYVVEKIKKKLQSENRDQDAIKFADLHKKFLRGTLNNRQAVLILLLHLSDQPKTNDTILMPLLKDPCPIYQLERPIRDSRYNLVGNEQSRKGGNVVSSRNTTQNFSTLESSTMFPLHWSAANAKKISANERVTSNATLTSRFDLQTSRKNSTTDVLKGSITDSRTSITSLGTVSERVLLKEVIYSFQGIEGNILKNDPVNGGFKIEPKIGLSKPAQNAVLRAAELGWLHNSVKQLCEDRMMCKTAGLVSQSLVAALRQELTEYYCLVAILEAQLQQEEEAAANVDALSLRRLAVWAIEPTARLRCLLAVAEATRGDRGGALAGGVHAFLQHGDPLVRETMKHILGAVCKPLYIMLSRWILDGELEDRYGEFFIATDTSVKGDRLWHDKYSIRETMLPTFISMSQARKILSTGKSINFLREVCEDHTPVKGREALKQALEKTSVEALFMEDRDGGLQAMMDTAYRETSLRVLSVMNEKYCFQDHLQALRQFLLLGQGDFIRYLMELIEPELGKPASTLYHHNLCGILESAIRATNVKHQSADILSRLDVHQLEVSPGDTGWDVFSLDYHVDGPIGAIFTPKEMTMYLKLFNALWRAKRMEWILSRLWKRQITSAKMLRKVPELRPIQQQTHLLISEMVHFVHQMQYYILFEVLECSWAVLMPQVQQAESLDDIIKAHSAFLQTVAKRTLLTSDTKDLLTQLRVVYDLILQLRGHADVLHTRAHDELAARDIKIKSKVVANGGEAEKEWLAKRKEFNGRFLPTTRAQLKILAQSYQDVVKRFLLTLTSQPDVSLQLLSSRLDFNEYYKKRDSRLTATLTYQHRRMSMFYGTATGFPLK